MRHFAKIIPCVIAVCVIAGCRSKVDFETSSTVALGDIKSFTVDAPKSQQKVAVSVTADSPVNVHVATSANQAAVHKALEDSKLPDAAKLLTSKDKVQTETLEATVPANTEFVVFISGATKKTEVKLKITSK